MERAIGEVFDFDGVKLRVARAKSKVSCEGCYFFHQKHPCYKVHGISITGKCDLLVRSDKKSVIFVRV